MGNLTSSQRSTVKQSAAAVSNSGSQTTYILNALDDIQQN